MPDETTQPADLTADDRLAEIRERLADNAAFPGDLRYLLSLLAARDAEIARLTAERDEAMKYLSAGRLFKPDGTEEPTTLVDRAKWTAAALAAETQQADECQAEIARLTAKRDELLSALRALLHAVARLRRPPHQREEPKV